MHDDIEDGNAARSLAQVIPIRGGEHVSLSTLSADDVGRRILQNDELVQLILGAANDMGPPMSVDEFKAWLDRIASEHNARDN